MVVLSIRGSPSQLILFSTGVCIMLTVQIKLKILVNYLFCFTNYNDLTGHETENVVITYNGGLCTK